MEPFLDDAAHERFDDSLERLRDCPPFLERFYEGFLADPEAAAFFEGVDMGRQRRALGASLFTLLLSLTRAGDVAELNRLAELHGPRGLAVPRHLFARWVDCLLVAARRCDPQMDDDLEAVWRRVLERGVDLMHERMAREPQ